MRVQELPQKVMGLSRLAGFEQAIRTTRDRDALTFAAVNELHSVVPYKHGLLWRADEGVVAVSGGLAVNKTAPQIKAIDRFARHCFHHAGRKGPKVFSYTRAQVCGAMGEDDGRWFGPHCVWLPFHAKGQAVKGGMVLLRHNVFEERHLDLLHNAGEALGHSFLVMEEKWLEARPRKKHGLKWLMLCAVLGALSLTAPFHQTYQADARIMSSSRAVLASSLHGVVDEILVEPNTLVRIGTPLVQLHKQDLEADVVQARSRFATAMAELERAQQKGQWEATSRGELAALEARVAEHRVAIDRAVSLVERSLLRAHANGLVIYDDPAQWAGKPVQIGEKIVTIADPKRLEIELHVSPEDAPLVAEGDVVKFYANARPQDPVLARVSSLAYAPDVFGDAKAGYLAKAVLESEKGASLGLTGVATIQGDKQMLIINLTRKPLALLRRFLGV